MGIKVQSVLDHTHSAMEPGKTISMSKLPQITGHTGENLLRHTANYMRIKLTGKLAPCEVYAQAKIRQTNISKKKMKKLPTRPGYRVFMDICSFKQVSRGGNRHWLIVVDEFSDCTHSFFLNRKSDTIYIKTQFFRLLRYYSPAPRNIARNDWATQNITHNMTS